MNDLAARQKRACEVTIDRMGRFLLGQVGAPPAMVLDRMMTFVAAQACAADGSEVTAAAFRRFADQIDAGVFHSVTGEGQVRN